MIAALASMDRKRSESSPSETMRGPVLYAAGVQYRSGFLISIHFSSRQQNRLHYPLALALISASADRRTIHEPGWSFL